MKSKKPIEPNWTAQLFVSANAKTDTKCYKCRQEFVDPMSSDHDLGNCEEEVLRWSDRGGYFSRGLDTVDMHIVLCEQCKFELLGPYMRFTMSPYEFHYARREKRDDEAVLQKWRARKARRDLLKTLKQKGLLDGTDLGLKRQI